MTGINRPFHRIIRPFALSPEIEYSPRGTRDWYFLDEEYAADRVRLIRAYHTIESDLLRLFEYVDPADGNQRTFSHRIFELLLRGCIEFEANCKSILRANGYNVKDSGIRDYYKIEQSSRLSEYRVRFLSWHGCSGEFQPLSEWSSGHSLSWYGSYNRVKHDRSLQFELANLENALLAVSAVLAVLFSQFCYSCLDSRGVLSMFQVDDGWYSYAGSAFAVKPPEGWGVDECYQFDWDELRCQDDRFSRFEF